MIGAPTFIARSMTLQIFSAYASDSDPPKTVKSWLKTKTSRPSMVPCPVTTPSPRIPPFAVAVGRDEGIEFDEGPGIEQQVESLARRQLAGVVLPLDAFRSPAEPRRGAHRRRAVASGLRRRVGRTSRARLPLLSASLRKDSRPS